MYEKLPSQETKIKNVTESANGCKLEMKTVMEKAHFFLVINSQSLILYKAKGLLLEEYNGLKLDKLCSQKLNGLLLTGFRK